MRNPYLPPSSVDGNCFERWVLGKSGRRWRIDNNTSFDKAVRGALRQWDGKRTCPDTLIGEMLHYHVLRSLKSFGVETNLVLFLCTSGTLADARFQSDAVFLVRTKDGRDLVATVDVAHYFDRKYLSMMDDEYTVAQEELYQQKRMAKVGQRGFKNWPENKPPNHFILSMNDLFRRGLKRLGRLIAQSIKDQYVRK